MGAKPYPAYKDSGVEWIGEIPEHWKVKRISDVSTLINGHPFASEGFSKESGFPLVRIRDLASKDFTTYWNQPFPPSAMIMPDDIVIGMDGDFNCVWWERGEALLNQRLCLLRFVGQVISRFAFYNLAFPLKAINDVTYFTTVKHLSSSQVKSIRIPSPPLEEQKLIASFLDRETGKMDTLVEHQQQLITLLKEKRQSLISHTVTKGLNPNVRMKDSGIEWIGDIPEHWEVKAFRTLGQFYGGLTGKAGPDFTDEGPNTQFFIPFTNILNNTYINWDELKPVQLDPLEKQNKVVSGDLLFLMSSEDYEFLGWSSVAENVPRLVYLNSFCKGFHLSANVSPAFINYFNKSIPGRSLIGSVGNGFTRINLRTSALASVKIPSPPLEEQKLIAVFLDTETSKIDQLIDKANQSIALLKERRSSLISAAVTGKIDVREAA